MDEYNIRSIASIKDRIKGIWYKYNGYILISVCVILVLAIIVVINIKSGSSNKYQDIERIMIINAQKYIKNNNISGNYYVSLNSLNINVDSKLNCNILSGVYKDNDNYYPYLVCQDYKSKKIIDLIEENDNSKEYGELNGDILHFVVGEKYEEKGVKTDYQVNIKGNDIDDGLNIVTYYINNKGKNLGELKRIVIGEDVIGNSPTLTLLGDKTRTIPKGSVYNDQGYKAIDEKDGNITDKVKINGNVDTTKPGTYVLTYSVTNSRGKTTKEQRTIIVNDQNIKLEISHTVDRNNNTPKSATMKLLIQGSGYESTVLPDNSKSTNREVSYVVYKNGTYDFVIYDTNGNGETYSVKITGLDPYKLTLIYNGNGQTSFSSKDAKHNFSLDKNDNVLDNGELYKEVIKYEKAINSSSGLSDYDGSYFNFGKTAHYVLNGKEWYVENNGVKTYYSQSDTTLKAEDIAKAIGCDLTKEDCTATIKVNWNPVYDSARPITKRFIIGDSRTVGMFRAVNSGSPYTQDQLARGEVTIGMDTWSCKSAMGYSWMVSTGIPNIENQLDQNSALIILMGVNGLDIDNYASYVEKKLPEWHKKGIRVYYVSVMPCNGAHNSRNKKIKEFNERIQKIDGLKYIDTHTYMMDYGYYSPDGLHYSVNTYKKVYSYIMSHLDD